MKKRQRIKLFIILGIEFIAIAVMLLLIFFAGKQVYTVTFDLNGGTLLSGDLVQKVTQGHNATAPNVTKEGCYFLKWSGSYSKVTRDVTVEAIWEYETSPGIEYEMAEYSNYCVISGCFEDLQGDIYIGAYYNNKKVLGIKDYAFAGREGITKIHLLDGILTIGKGAFEGCTSLETIELPATATFIGEDAFKDCTKLKKVTLPEDLKTLGGNAFQNCTSLEEVVLFEKLEEVGNNAFAGCVMLKEITLPSSLLTMGSNVFDQALTIYACTYVKENPTKPLGWAEDFYTGEAVFEWKYIELEPSEDETDDKDKNKDKDSSLFGK